LRKHPHRSDTDSTGDGLRLITLLRCGEHQCARGAQKLDLVRQALQAAGTENDSRG
jgi:hypothetical protein